MYEDGLMSLTERVSKIESGFLPSSIMGNDSGRKDGEGTSGGNKFDKNYGQQRSFPQGGVLLHNHANGRFPDPMAQSSADNPRLAFHPPLLMVTPQVPAVALQRAGEAMQPQHALLQNGHVEYVLHEKMTRVKISWNHTGNNVAITGSWDNWKTTELLQSSGVNFITMKTLPEGIYQYRFIVDGYLTYAPDFPWQCDDSGYAYNILDLQEYIPETIPRLSDYESPPSPPSSYDNRSFNEDEFSKPPPDLPPQLPVTISNEPPSTKDSHHSPSGPTHVELNHLYICKNEKDPLVALRSTHRFQQKFVTVIFYRPLYRER
ncbi:SNF1-related protein kinase regulatory subunit beta-2 [Quillaja saponaria]|uniref:SNF1-related protein kinase regulatory subunit beta-2 n=1 Tax=Quillaja saponaria TaxID=32244 RepID=A0AAD7PQY5_QUISA|nr:SNF1-related protein kinase regulatory subunit beta-2 [Quillaja saponaria]